MVWVGLLLLGAVSAFIGYQTFSSIPEKIRAEIHAVAEAHKTELDNKFTKLEQNLQTQEAAIKSTADRVKSEANDADNQIKQIQDNANKSARQRVEQIAIDYTTRFRDFQIDTDLRLLQHQSGEVEIVRQLVHAFPNVDPSRQNSIVTTLVNFEIPESDIAAFKTTLEGWRPANDNAVAQSARYQLLIQHRSNIAKDEIQEKMKIAVQDSDSRQIETLIKYIWQVFHVSSGNGPAFGLSTGDMAESINELARQRLLRQRVRIVRPRVRDIEASASDYQPTFRLALESPAARSVLKMILEIMEYAKLPDIESPLAKVLLVSKNDSEIVSSVVPVIPRLTDNSEAYKAVMTILSLNSDKLKSSEYESLPDDVLAYSSRNLATLKSEEDLRTTVAGVLLPLLGDPGDIDKKMLANYLITGNLFPGGVTLSLMNEKNKEEISSIQLKDKPFTPIHIADNLKLNFGEGEVVRIQKVLVDGSDDDDERLGVQIIIDVDGQSHTLSFEGSERLLLQSQKPKHVVETNKGSLRFGIEIKSQRLTLMAVPL